MKKVTLQGFELINKVWLMPKLQLDALLSTLMSAGEVKLDDAGPMTQYSPKEVDTSIGEYIGIVLLTGVLFRTASTGEDGEPMGADATVAQLETCYNDPKCKGVIIKVNCPGGMEDAAYLVTDAVRRRNKPVAAWLEFGQCQSGGMMIASGCDITVASSETDRAGGIGAYITYTDWSKAMEMNGIKATDVYAPQSKQKNLDVRQAAKGDYKLLTEYVAQRATYFQTLVYVNRMGRWNEGPRLVDTFEGAELSAAEAVEVGLIDGIGPMESVINWINWANQN
jgi:protease-4